MKNLIQVELEKLEPRIKWVTNMINEAENEGVYNEGDPQEMYLRGMFYQISSKLDEVRRYIRQVTAPVIEEGILHKGKDGRYTTGKHAYYTSGASIEYLFEDSTGESRWVYSHVEHNGNDYYIVNTPDCSMEGLKVRVKKLLLWD
ncbi:DUF5348 domain-containing protein [Paenibacillus sp. FSL E2-8871]|uniref:DUF5348 domain-containing protein n=1 Tax=Paenibacillus sp. FSL E2-8871 TaxID=2975326 RepID=UPI0030F5D3B0